MAEKRANWMRGLELVLITGCLCIHPGEEVRRRYGRRGAYELPAVKEVDFSLPPCTVLSTAALFMVAHKCKHPKRPPTDECIDKMQYTHTMQRARISRNEVLTQAPSWKNLENSVPNGRSRHRRTTID